jgi:hypothetical protein
MDRSPGSLFYEEIDAMTWADWEMDCEYLTTNLYKQATNAETKDVKIGELTARCGTHQKQKKPFIAKTVAESR